MISNLLFLGPSDEQVENPPHEDRSVSEINHVDDFCDQEGAPPTQPPETPVGTTTTNELDDWTRDKLPELLGPMIKYHMAKEK